MLGWGVYRGARTDFLTTKSGCFIWQIHCLQFEVDRFDVEITIVMSCLKIALHVGIVLTANMKYLVADFVFPM